jgi:peptidyl-prolyl cis-trans isomerase SurA
MMKTIVHWTLFFCLLGWAFEGNSVLVDRIVAIVNDDAITLSELEDEVAPFAKQVGKAVKGPGEEQHMLSKIREEVLEQMIERKLTDQECKRLNISVNDSDVDAYIERIKKQNFFTNEDFSRALAAQGATMEEYRNRVTEQILRSKIITQEVKSKIAITGTEIQDYYEKNKELYGEKRKFHLRAILVKITSWDDREEIAGVQKNIQLIFEKLQDMPFEEVARQYSEDVSAKRGGDLGLFSLDELTPELQETVGWMKEGEISPALQTPQGYQILFVENIEGSAVKTLDDLKMEIQDKLFMEKVEEQYKTWLEALRNRSFIKKKL